MIIDQIKSALQDLSNVEKVNIYTRFFKTGKGEYGEGDAFLGVTVPHQRLVAKEYYNQVSLKEIGELVKINIHEYRLTALIMLVYQFEKIKDINQQKVIIDFYLNHTKYINNWDLVDTSCYKILGRYCYHQNQEQILFDLSQSENLWEKRIAIVSTLYYIKMKSLDIVPEIVLKNMNHSHDLMHKANGWMLREMGKIDDEKLIYFLDQYATQLPRTSLRYALEKLEPTLKDYYMKLK